MVFHYKGDNAMKSFKGCIFKLHLPMCVTFDKTAEFKCKFVFGEQRENIVFSEARLINIFNEISQADIDMPITNEKSSHFLNFSITGNKSVFLKNAKLEMTFLQENGQKILVSYLFKNSQKIPSDIFTDASKALEPYKEALKNEKIFLIANGGDAPP